jgi:hypothetical protein
MKKAGMFLANVFLCFIMACELRARGQRDRIPPAWTVNCVGQSAAKGLRGISEVLLGLRDRPIRLGGWTAHRLLGRVRPDVRAGAYDVAADNRRGRRCGLIYCRICERIRQGAGGGAARIVV